MLSVTNKLGTYGDFPSINLGLSSLGKLYQTHCLLYTSHIVISLVLLIAVQFQYDFVKYTSLSLHDNACNPV